MPSQTAFNPVARANGLMLRNLLLDTFARPWLAGMILLMALTVSGLIGQMLLTAIEHRRDLFELWVRDYAIPLWAGLYTLSLASFLPLARRQIKAATNGWLANLPQMPQAARRQLSLTLRLLCLLQNTLLLGLLTILTQHFTKPMPWFNWLLAMAVPAAAVLTTIALANRAPPDAFNSRSGTPSSRRPCRSTADILRHWQWAAFLGAFWAPAMRWALGGLLILIPAGVSSTGVAITLITGWAMIQAMNAWAAWMQVIVEASRLLRALPTKTGPILWALSVWPLALISVVALLVSLGLLMLGAAPGSVILALLLITSVSLLALAGVMAWRYRGRIPQWRITAIIMLWLLLAQSMPPAAPVIWLLLVVLLIKRAYRQ